MKPHLWNAFGSDQFDLGFIQQEMIVSLSNFDIVLWWWFGNCYRILSLNKTKMVVWGFFCCICQIMLNLK